MSRTLKWILGALAAAGVLALLIFAFIEGRGEIAREREREAPIKVAPRISRTAQGDLVVTVDMETQKRIGLETTAPQPVTVAPEIVAYGRTQEDPGSSFIVRAPVSGVLRLTQGRNWPAIGDSLPDGANIGVVEQRLALSEKIGLATQAADLSARRADLATKLSDARADTEAADARLAAARAAVERLRTLNADNKNVSDRSVQESEANQKAEEARAAAARRNVTALEAAVAGQTAPTENTPIPLPVARGGEVVEVLARPNESIESGQPILRVTRFDNLLARVDLPTGEPLDRRVATARIAAVGHEDQAVMGQRASLAATVDPDTLGEGLVFRLSGAPSYFRPGAAVTAYLQAPGAAQEALLVPHSAIVRSEGRTWVYLQLDNEKFSRREVALDHPRAEGFLITGTLKAGDRIVTRGAQLLLSEEQKSQIQILEEAEQK